MIVALIVIALLEQVAGYLKWKGVSRAGLFLLGAIGCIITGMVGVSQTAQAATSLQMQTTGVWTAIFLMYGYILAVRARREAIRIRTGEPLTEYEADLIRIENGEPPLTKRGRKRLRTLQKREQAYKLTYKNINCKGKAFKRLLEPFMPYEEEYCSTVYDLVRAEAIRINPDIDFNNLTTQATRQFLKDYDKTVHQLIKWTKMREETQKEHGERGYIVSQPFFYPYSSWSLVLVWDLNEHTVMARPEKENEIWVKSEREEDYAKTYRVSRNFQYKDVLDFEEAEQIAQELQTTFMEHNTEEY